MRYTYFVSFAKMNDVNSGFGRVVVETDGKIVSVHEVEMLENTIKEQIGAPESSKIILQNFQLLSSTPN